MQTLQPPEAVKTAYGAPKSGIHLVGKKSAPIVKAIKKQKGRK